MAEDFIVTPWEVSGDVNYSELIKRFGTKPLTEELRNRIAKHAGKSNMFLDRGLFFSHRDLEAWLGAYEKKEKVYLYTGRAPSGPVHIGHLVPWMMTKYLQDSFKAPLLFQIPDEEKFLFEEKLTLKDTNKWAYDNILDIIALGFDSKKTDIFLDTEYSKTMYKVALEVSKRVTFSTAKAVFGFNNSNNLGSIFYTCMQSVPAFLPSIKEGKATQCLIPHAIDQDPHFRITRDVAPLIGFPKPCAIHNKFIPGLKKGSKMSASKPETCIFTIDTAQVVEKKIMNTFTGGRDTVEEQRKLGGNFEICTVYKYLYYMFEKDDKKLREREKKCKSGEILCGECKSDLVKYINSFLKVHRANREKAKDKINKFLLKD